jgi:hypothetical protein
MDGNTIHLLGDGNEMFRYDVDTRHPGKSIATWAARICYAREKTP